MLFHIVHIGKLNTPEPGISLGPQLVWCITIPGVTALWTYHIFPKTRAIPQPIASLNVFPVCSLERIRISACHLGNSVLSKVTLAPKDEDFTDFKIYSVVSSCFSLLRSCKLEYLNIFKKGQLEVGGSYQKWTLVLILQPFRKMFACFLSIQIHQTRYTPEMALGRNQPWGCQERCSPVQVEPVLAPVEWKAAAYTEGPSAGIATRQHW